MQPNPEASLPLHIRLLHDAGTASVLALILVPAYLLLNQYWRSLFLLTGFYALLGFAFLRLGWYIRRVHRRLPAEIPPWLPRPRTGAEAQQNPLHTSCAPHEVMRSAIKDPRYVQDVMKPRLRHLLAYRLSGSLDTTFDDLREDELAKANPALLEFLNRSEDTNFWTAYRNRAQRLREVSTALQQIEAL